jgi:hypothetical protein
MILEATVGFGIISWISGFVFKKQIKKFVIRHCNSFFFDRYFLQLDEKQIEEIIHKCTHIFENIETNEQALTISLEESVFFNYYKISDASTSVFIGPVNASKKEIVKPFICYSNKTENMGIKDIDDKLFFLTLFKDQKINK